MLLNKFPTFDYISWKSLVIIDSDEIPYIVYDGESCMKYIYWETSNPYILRESNERLETSVNRYLIYINDYGEGTEVINDGITLQYRDTGSGGMVAGAVLGKFEELDGRFYSIEQDVDGLKEIIGSTEEGGESISGGILDRLTTVEKTAEGIREEVTQIQTVYDDDKKMNQLRDNILSALITLGISLSEYENTFTSVSKDYRINTDDKTLLSNCETDVLQKLAVLKGFEDEFLTILEKNPNNASVINSIEKVSENLTASVNNVNSLIGTVISDNTIVTSEITTALNLFAVAGVKIVDYKNTLSNAMVLGVGGTVVSNLLEINKTATEFSQKMEEIVEDIDGTNGLKEKISQNATSIEQTANNLSLNYLKYDKVTSSLSVSDQTIKLDAQNVLMTGTLTWDSLDAEAKENLKGESGTAEYIMLVGDQIIKYNKSLVPNVEAIVLNVQNSNISNPNYKWSYRADKDSAWQQITENQGKNSITISHDSYIWGNRPSVTIRVTCGSSNEFYDDLTIIKLYDGINGTNAKYLKVAGGNVFRYEDTLQGVASPSQLVIKSELYGSDMISRNWSYRKSNSTTWVKINKYTPEITINPNDEMWSNETTSVILRCECDGAYDEITLVKLIDGMDSYTVLLSNENDSFIANSDGSITSSTTTTTDVIAYKGIESATPEIGTLPTVPGLTLSKSGNRITIKTNTGTSLTDSGGFDIPITVNGHPFVKRFSWTKAKQGFDGIDAQYVTITGNEMFRYEGVSNIPTPEQVILKGNRFNMTLNNSRWYYRMPENEDWIEITSARDNDTFVVNHNDSTLFNTNNTIGIKYQVGDCFDTVSIVKLYDGVDGIAVVLTNENHSVPCDEEGNYEEEELAKAFTEIRAYSGIKEVNYNLTKTDEGCVSTFSVATKKLTITKLTENTAKVILNINVSGKVFQKVMTITKALRGLKGLDGTGIEVKGQLNSTSELPANGQQGDAYVIDGLIYVWNITDNGWSDGVPFKGEKGNPGKDGVDGRTSYLHIKYSDDGTSFTANNGETPGAWLGQYTDFEEDDSTEFSDYTWKKIRGEDGYHGIVANLSNESHVIPTRSDGSYDTSVFNGCDSMISLSYDGKVLTSGVSYSCTVGTGVQGSFNSSTGRYTVTGLTVDNGYVDLKALYNGVTYTKRFTIVKNKDGIDAQYITVNGEQIFRYEQSFNFEPTPKTIKLTANRVFIDTPCQWAFKRAGDSAYTDISGATNDIYTVNPANTSIFTNNTVKTVTFKYYSKNNPTIYDEISITRVIDGVDGEHAYTVLLSNENHSFPCEPNGNIESSLTTSIKVIAYKGIKEVVPTIGELPTVNGLTLSKSGDTITVIANTGNSLAKTGTFTIPIVIDENKFEKTFSWTKGFRGVDGVDGENGFTINLSNENHSFIAQYDGEIVEEQTASTLITAFSKDKSVGVTIGNLPTVPGMTLSKSGATITLKVSKGKNLAQNGTITIPILVEGIEFSRTFSYSRVDCGKDGYEGKDGYTITLTSENHSFLCEANGNIPSALTTTTTVKVYYGTTAITPTIGTLPTVSGLTLSKSGSTITIKANAGTNLNSTGSFNIPITVNGLSFTKTFSWNKVNKGQAGTNGQDAVIPSWITEWDNGKTTINGSTVLSPKIFAGTVDGGKPTGVAIGKNVFGTSGTYANINGIAGYHNGNKTYHFTTDGKILIGNTSGNYLSWNGNALEVKANKISLGSTTVATTVDVNGVQSNLNNLQIGGRNLVSNSAPKDLTGWSASNGWKISLVTCTNATYGKAIRCTNNGGTTGGMHKPPIQPKENYSNGEDYTISAWIRASVACQIDFRNEMMSNNIISITTSWKKYTFTGKINTSSTYYSDAFYINGTPTNGMWFEVHSLKFEKGQKATDWTDAPEDIENKFITIDTKTTEIEADLQITKDSINSKVSQTTYDANNNTINQKISAVTQTANKISWLVKDGSSSSSVQLTSSAMKFISQNINITGKVTFSSFDSATQSTINGIQSTANNAYTTANNANSKATTATNKVNAWTYSGTTEIDGARIRTGTLSASQITTGTLTGVYLKGNVIDACERIGFGSTSSAVIMGATGDIHAGMIISANTLKIEASSECTVVSNKWIFKGSTTGTTCTIELDGALKSGSIYTNYLYRRSDNALYLSFAGGDVRLGKNLHCNGWNITNASAITCSGQMRSGSVSTGSISGSSITCSSMKCTGAYTGPGTIWIGRGGIWTSAGGSFTSDYIRLNSTLLIGTGSGNLHVTNRSGSGTSIYCKSVASGYSLKPTEIFDSVTIQSIQMTENESSVFDEINKINVIDTDEGYKAIPNVQTVQTLSARNSSPIVNTYYDEENEEVIAQIDYTSAISTLIKAVQELKSENNLLRQEIEELKGE